VVGATDQRIQASAYHGVGTTLRWAAYIGRVLKGGKPAELPVQAPTKLELTINLNIAKAFGITISPNLLVQAEQVIE
jgi:putative tryptophan/tyrosine transport system substrate-binding protein